MASRRPRTLVVLLCETRAAELTSAEFFAHVLEPLDADLALCVGSHEQPNAFYDRATYIWRATEPDDWSAFFERETGDRRWEVLLDLHEMFLGPLTSATHKNVGSGAIIMYFRRFLARSLREAGVLDAYDWFVVTRSDYRWPIDHPPIALLDSRRIYALNGEQYLGVSDRHIIVPRRYMSRYLDVVEPIFTAPEKLRERLAWHVRHNGWPQMNPERFLAARMADLGLWSKVRFLPYVPFAVRAPGGTTRWAEGEFDEGLGYYVKYPDERARSEITQRFVERVGWEAFLRPYRGSPARFAHWLAYRRAGLAEPIMPRWRADPRRAAHALRRYVRDGRLSSVARLLRAARSRAAA